jgi:nicotinate phosphoribosyltransferase
MGIINNNSGYIINSLLDTDTYKFSMMQVVLHQFSGVQVEYEYKCRNKKVKWTKEMQEDLEKEIEHLYTLTFTENELEYLSTLRFLKSDYIDFLRLFKLDKRYINISYTEENELNINIKGPWLMTILFETLILSIVNEVYFKYYGVDNIDIGRKILEDKIQKLKNGLHILIPPYIDKNFKLIDFGARRRYSRKWHEEVIDTLVKKLPDNFIGTSDVLMAKNNKIKPIGTHAHEFICAFQSLVRVKDSQKTAFQSWANEYRGDLGIALSDTLGIDAFIRDFDMYFCKLFDGCRHDSGNPFIWTDKIIKMYEGYNIDPKTKIAVYSDGLDIDKALEIYKYVNGRMKTTFGIGTNLTNDFTGAEPLNIVIKMIKCQGMPVAKLSDSAGKVMCKDDNYLIYLKSQFGIK